MKNDIYIEIELTEIREKHGLFKRTKIVKSRVGFLFDLYCWLNMSDMEMIALNDLGKWDNDTFMLNVCYYACISACKERGDKVTFSKSDVQRWIKRMPQEDFQSIFDTMVKSRIMGKTIEEWAKEAEGSKKKSGLTISKTTQSANSASG
jgi:hypothetical protein